MATDDIVFSDINDDIAYDPYVIATAEDSSGVLVGGAPIRITNFGEDDLSNVGIYLASASNVGDVDNPAHKTPGRDYQDLLTWGTTTVLDPSVTSGGVKISFDEGTNYTYITRSAGSTYTNRIIIPERLDSEGNTLLAGTLKDGETIQVEIDIEVPDSEPTGTRRLFINMVAE